MACNAKSLLEDELEYLKLKYKFELVRTFDMTTEYVLVSCADYDRKIAHNTSKSFWLNTSIRHFTISPKGIVFWKKLGINNYHLIEVQNAINQLKLLDKDVNEDSIKNRIESGSIKIKTINSSKN